MDIPAELYFQIFEHAPIGFAVSDEDGRVVNANAALLAVGGWTRGELDGKSALDFYYDGAKARDQAVALVRSQGRLDRHEVRFKKKDGSFFWAHMSLRPAAVEGRRYIIAMIEDVSELKDAQRQRDAQIKELEQLTRLLTGREVKMMELKKRIDDIEKLREDKKPRRSRN